MHPLHSVENRGIEGNSSKSDTTVLTTVVVSIFFHSLCLQLVARRWPALIGNLHTHWKPLRVQLNLASENIPSGALMSRPWIRPDLSTSYRRQFLSIPRIAAFLRSKPNRLCHGHFSPRIEGDSLDTSDRSCQPQHIRGIQGRFVPRPKVLVLYSTKLVLLMANTFLHVRTRNLD